MDTTLFLGICRNDYRAVFQMLKESIKLCPEHLWNEQSDEPPFWQQAYHTIFYLDFYLSESPQSFKKPDFVEAQDKSADLGYRSPKPHSREQIVGHLDRVSNKCNTILDNLTSEQLRGKNAFQWTGPTLAHRLIYNIRHAQHHVGRLNSILSRKTGKAAGWVITASM